MEEVEIVFNRDRYYSQHIKTSNLNIVNTQNVNIKNVNNKMSKQKWSTLKKSQIKINQIINKTESVKTGKSVSGTRSDDPTEKSKTSRSVQWEDFFLFFYCFT